MGKEYSPSSSVFDETESAFQTFSDKKSASGSHISLIYKHDSHLESFRASEYVWLQITFLIPLHVRL